MKTLATLILTACVLAVSATAGTAVRTVDMRSVLVPSATLPKMESVQNLASVRALDGNISATRLVFADRPASLELQHFPISATDEGTLVLERTRAPYDATTKFRVGTKDGPREVILQPVVSYRGTILGDLRTRVSLHVSYDGEMTGVIDRGDGSQVVIGRDLLGRETATSVPHVVGLASDVVPGAGPNAFVCGAEALPISEDVIRNYYNTTVKQGTAVQADSMREIKMAVEVREDATEQFYRRGQDDEQIFAYMVKIWAAINQAYEEEANATFFLTDVFLYNNDFTSPYPGSTTQLNLVLDLFAEQWSVRTDIERDAAHLFCLFPSGGGVIGIAHGIGGLCNIYSSNQPSAYAVSTIYANANTEIPGRPDRANAYANDVMTPAHEVGHNIGSVHTHNCLWSPPVDTCILKEDGYDGCYSRNDVSRVVRDGTIMSYCHIPNGDRTPLTFGDRVALRMKQWVANSCAKVIARPWVRITEPRGAENFSAGTTVLIKFASARATQLDLEYTTDGSTWLSIAKNVNAALRQYAWTLPTISTNSLLIRAFASDNPTACDTTLASYVVSTPLALVTPKGGERFYQGQDIQVAFTKGAGINDVKIEVTGNGTDWTTLATVGGSTLSYTFPAPAVETEQARVRISSGAFTTTSNPFAIGAPRFQLTWPVAGGTICNNFDNQYKWVGDFIDRIRIRYSKDGGTTWENAVQQLTIDQYASQIFGLSTKLRDEAVGTKIMIGVFNQRDATTPIATADNITVGTCSSVTDVQDDFVAGATALQIVSITPNPASTTATVTYTSATAKPVQIDVYAVNGTRVLSVSATAAPTDGTQVSELGLAGLASGAYTVVISSGGVQETASLTVTR
jgi:hypothetical protein